MLIETESTLVVGFNSTKNRRHKKSINDQHEYVIKQIDSEIESKFRAKQDL